MKVYFEKTERLRNDESLLFLTTINSFKAASWNFILRWIKNLLGLAGINANVFKPYLTHNASTSYTKQKVLIETILKTEGRRSLRTFTTFYGEPAMEADF